MNHATKSIAFIIALTLFSLSVRADMLKPIKWQKTVEQIDENTFEIIFSAKIDAGWHLYGLNIPEGGPIATSFNFKDADSYKLIGAPTPSVKAEKKFDPTFEMELELFSKQVTFRQKVKLLKKQAVVSGYIEFMACDDSRCLPPVEDEFEFTLTRKALIATSNEKPVEPNEVIATGSSRTDSAQVSDNPDKELTASITGSSENLTKTQDEKPAEPARSLWSIFWEAVSKGFLAVLTPCVYPIIPLTIAFFMRDNSTGRRIFQALFFGFSIVAIYTAVGLIAGLAKIDIIELSKHWLANLILFGLLLVIAASFFGMFEIVLPGSLSNKLDQQVDKGGLLAPFFLALATAVVSFSCVGPIAGHAIGAAMTGELLGPVVAMAGFSASFALPFVILGIFPGLLKNLPKSGGWLNAVKVFFAFIILASSLIFLGNTQFKVFSRDVILALEIVIFILLGMYLLGKIKFAHDSDLPFIKVPRLLLAIMAFSVAVYLVPGLFGSPLKVISPFLPEPETSELNLSGANKTMASAALNPVKLCHENPKYADELHLPHGLKGYFDYAEGLACAKEQNKPVLLDFVGHSCKNCKKMYAEVWSDPEILSILNDNFIIIALYTDDRTALPENEWYISSFDGKEKKTLGKKNQDIQFTKFATNTLPAYAIADAKENILTAEKFYSYSPDIKAFKSFLLEGITNYKKKYAETPE